MSDCEFHFLVRVAGVAATFHLRLNAGSQAAAKRRVLEMPHLIEWLEISGKELAEILENERNKELL
jgi:hypothetical protein